MIAPGLEQRLTISRREGARKFLEQGLAEYLLDKILDRVSLLDGLVRYRFGDDSELMAAWVSARNVIGPFRSKSGTPKSTSEETPPSGGVAPAA